MSAAPLFDANSRAGIVLRALRAGEMDSSQVSERWGCTSKNALAKLVREGFVSVRCLDDGGRIYRLTDAGRAACPSWRTAPATTLETPRTRRRTQPDKSKPVTTQIVHALHQLGRPVVFAEIAAELPHLKSKPLRNSLHTLVTKGRVTGTGSNRRYHYTLKGAIHESA